MNALPFGTNMLLALARAAAAATATDRPFYVYQTTGGAFLHGMYIPADDPFIMVNPDGAARLGCDTCEGEVRRRAPLAPAFSE